ncbi:hypothetical protein [Brevundimonas sp.]|uniref:hypothetical protein n=1 Tax=Brevundimonas sp. TaxID=1871086 RepID=UPI002FD9C68B
MKLRATISIDFEAEDVLDARSKKREIETRLQALQATYDDLSLVVTERRPRIRPRAPAPAAVYRPAATAV